MESHEILREVYKEHCEKQLAVKLQLGISTIYKWGETCDPAAVSPVERTGQLLECLGADDRLIQHLCQRAGGTFVRNPPAPAVAPELPVTVGKVELRLTELLGVIAGLLTRQRKVAEEATRLRSCWERCKSAVEGFMQACERGSFRLMALFYPLGWWLVTGDSVMVES